MKNTTLCYIEKDSSYLMLYRIKKENDENKDKYIGIGGRIEEKESPEDCILREAYEETGLSLKNLEYRGLVTFVSDIYETEFMHLFHCDDFCGNLKECDEGELLWVKKEKLFSLPMWEGDKIFLDLLEQKVPFFSLKLEYEGDNLKRVKLNNEEISLPYLSSKKY